MGVKIILYSIFFMGFPICWGIFSLLNSNLGISEKIVGISYYIGLIVFVLHQLNNVNLSNKNLK
jgi:hypothetical protein